MAEAIFLPESALSAPGRWPGYGKVDITVTAEKPFNICFHCRYFKAGCSGPDITKMRDVYRVCEFLETARILMGYTYQQVGDACDMTRQYVSELLRGERKNPSFEAIQRISKYLTSDPDGVFPCALHLHTAETDRAVADCAAAQAALAAEQRKVAHLLRQTQGQDTIIVERAEFLRQKDLVIARLQAAAEADRRAARRWLRWAVVSTAAFIAVLSVALFQLL